MFTTEIYGKQIKSETLRGLKMQASKIANRCCNVIDEMIVTSDVKVQLFPSPITFKMIRRNKKCPNNTITYGQWS